MKAIKYVFAQDAAGLLKLHAAAVKAVASARVSIQVAAVATLKHAHVHGDWTFAGKLVESLGNTINGAALVEFFKVYGGLTTDDKGFIGWKGKDFIAANFEAAKEKMWWELKKPNPFKGFDLEAALQRVIKEHATMQEKVVGLSDEDKAKVKFTVNDATVQAVLKLCNFDAIFATEPGTGPAIDADAIEGELVDADKQLAVA